LTLLMENYSSPKNLHNSVFQLRKIFFLLLACVAAYQPSNGQVSWYTFGASAGTYTAITGTTVVTGTWDDANSNLITLPFTFTYNNIAYTTAAINSNGFLVMGAVNN